jgi:hypothetical protein
MNKTNISAEPMLPLLRARRGVLDAHLGHLIAVAVVFGAFAYAQSAACAQKSGKRPPAAAASRAQASGRVTYKTVKIDMLSIFYREAVRPRTRRCCCCTASRPRRICFAI